MKVYYFIIAALILSLTYVSIRDTYRLETIEKQNNQIDSLKIIINEQDIMLVRYHNLIENIAKNQSK